MPATTALGDDAIPDQSGRTVVVTGANSGIGFETARALVERGAHVVLACRSLPKARVAVEALERGARGSGEGSAEVMALDLASLDSIRTFARELIDRHPRLDLLFNNAGVMALPFKQTADGFEMQIGTNHLGHFALTGLLLPRLLETPGSRVVTTASAAHRLGRIRFDDLHGRRRYNRMAAYGQSKLANLLFAYELDRRLRRRDHETLSVAAHPGYAATNLQAAGPHMSGARLVESVMNLGNRILAQSAAAGARPQLLAGTAAGIAGGDYLGPSGLLELRGAPRRVRANARARDEAAALRLWDLSSELTGVTYAAIA